MKHIINVLRTIVFIPILLFIIWGVYWLIGNFVLWLIKLKLIWLIIAGGTFLCFGISATLFLFPIVSSLLLTIIPYKNLGRWLAAILITLFGLLQVVLVWKYYDLEQARLLIGAIVFTILFLYVEMSFIMGLFMEASEIKSMYRKSS